VHPETQNEKKPNEQTQDACQLLLKITHSNHTDRRSEHCGYCGRC